MSLRARPGASPWLRIRIHCSAARWTTRWRRRWRAFSSNSATRRGGPNFRGVGLSEGSHDEGRGELEDLAAVIEHTKSEKPVLAGFSFGAAIQTRLAQRVKPERMALVGVAVKHFEAPPVPADTIVIHGEEDTTVLLSDVLAWARPQDLPVVVIPGADHFFHRRLHILRSIIQGNWK